MMEHSFASRRFTEEEMTSDPPVEAPKITTTSYDDALERAPRSKEWFQKHSVTRVPLIALETDPYKVASQAWACFSIIKPEHYGKLKHGDREYHGQLIKFRGAFATRDEAEKHIHRLMKVDKHFDIHLVPGFQWSSIDDDNLDDREYATEMIGEVMKGYFKQENHRMMGIRSRIENTENPVETRSEEATRFFEECQRDSEQKLLTHGDDERELDGVSITLDELAKQHGLQPGADCAVHEGFLSKEQVDSVVKTVILEEEEEGEKSARAPNLDQPSLLEQARAMV